ncbi:putative oligosaccharyl transferase subunit [Trypanosoma cruzi]|uniref:Putative oligosaccharyl transferase subunit n=1 Tax=Trypanosoma cruzi TaxID=5693 RepID=A0A2V2WUV6_TRYCR|nr:putative oligosaccharyl transferase subunit [Trypanosoma cruzi]
MRAQLRTGEIVMLGRLLRLVPVAAQQHTGGRPHSCMVGLRLPDHGDRESHEPCGRQHVNHEHIATIGKLLTSPVAKAHLLIRHLADYVLIWTGSRAEDLMKSPHMARIGNSVYRDICPEDDPLCSNFGFEDYDLSRPTPMMRMSLLYNLHVSGESPSPAIDNMFRLAYRSRHGLVRSTR